MTSKESSAIFLVSSRSDAIASYRGPLISFPIVKSLDREKGLLRRWIVFSQGKRPALVKYLYGKLLWDELNRLELDIWWHLREITEDISIYLSLKALVLGTPKRDLRKRLLESPFPELWVPTRQQYLSVKGQVSFFLKEETLTLRRIPKFKTYTKHYKDKGSLGIDREYYFPEILEPYENVSEEILLKYLTVGEFSLFRGEVPYPDEEPKSSKR
jgi:hypothetical protein